MCIFNLFEIRFSFIFRTSGFAFIGRPITQQIWLTKFVFFFSLFCFCLFIPDNNEICHSGTATPVTISAPATSQMNRINASTAVTIGAQMNLSTTVNTVNITSAPVSLQHPVTITGPVNIASVNIPATASAMNIAHPVAITTPMSMNIAAPLNIAMRSMDSMPFLSQVLPSSPPW